MTIPYQGITTRYVGPGNVRGSRIIATSASGQRCVVPYDDAGRSEDAHVKAARALAVKLGWQGRWVMGGTKTGYAFVCVHDDEILEF